MPAVGLLLVNGSRGSEIKAPVIILMNVRLVFLPDLSITASREECVYCEHRSNLRVVPRRSVSLMPWK